MDALRLLDFALLRSFVLVDEERSLLTAVDRVAAFTAAGAGSDVRAAWRGGSREARYQTGQDAGIGNHRPTGWNDGGREAPEMDRRDEGLWAWKQKENNNRMIALQRRSLAVADAGAVELAYFGGSAFRITSPAGLTIMIDPWRNPPRGDRAWFLHDFPDVEVDIGISTHAHFDHDALHVLRASTLLDRPVGTFAFADVRITGIADKHVSDTSHNAHDWAETTRTLTGMETRPPDNWRSFDNCLILVETAGLRILHWGDNRPDPSDHVWDMLGAVDVALLPIDGSQHVLSDAQADAVARRLKARLVVPHHYYMRGVVAPASTLLPPDRWVDGRPGSRRLAASSVTLVREQVRAHTDAAFCFGDHVAFATPMARKRNAEGP